MEDETIRVSTRFNKEIEDIKEKRKEAGIDKKRISSRALTSLIPRHKLWKKIKEEMIEYKFKNNTNFENEN